jgi:hypothetical protein
MKVEQIDIEKIKPYIYNPRKNLNSSKIATSIKKFGFQQPIVVDKEFIIVVGHTRYEAAKILELKKVPVVVADLTKSKAKAYRIADNKLNEHSDWDYNLLNTEFKDLVKDDYNLEDLGFSENEIENITKYMGDETDWLKTDEHWKDMPEFQHGNEAPYRSIHVHFKTQKDMETFFKLIKQDFTDKTKYVWYPQIEKNVLKDKGYVEE